MVNNLNKDGYICLIVPSSGSDHKHPVDCWRFKTDSMKALEKYINCLTDYKIVLRDTYTDPRGEWKDCVGVFQRC
jgi:hypothetical protein